MTTPQQPDRRQTTVYVAKFPFSTLSSFVPSARQSEIDGCASRNVADSKYYAFKLLEIALSEVYNAKMNDCNLVRADNGKWSCDVCEFSLSHCDDVVAVAVSDLPVGVDVQRVAPSRFDDRLQSRIFTPNEQSCAKVMTADARRDYANRIWTIKEAAFKRTGGSNFVPSKIDSEAANCATVSCSADTARYYLTTAGADVDNIRYVALNVDLNG